MLVFYLMEMFWKPQVIPFDYLMKKLKKSNKLTRVRLDVQLIRLQTRFIFLTRRIAWTCNITNCTNKLYLHNLYHLWQSLNKYFNFKFIDFEKKRLTTQLGWLVPSGSILHLETFGGEKGFVQFRPPHPPIYWQRSHYFMSISF